MHGIGTNILFDPVSNDDTKDVQGKFNGDELSAGFVLGGFGGPNRNNGVEHSCSPSIDETGANHPSVVLSRSLKSCTKYGPSSSKSNGLDTAVTVTKPTTDETADQSTEVIDRNNATLEKSVVNDRGTSLGIRMTEFHSGVIVVDSSVHAPHHALVVSKKEDGKTSDAVDSDEKATLLKFVDHIGPGNDIHGGNYPECLDQKSNVLLDY